MIITLVDALDNKIIDMCGGCHPASDGDDCKCCDKHLPRIILECKISDIKDVAWAQR